MINSITDWLKKLGWLGGIIANVIQILTFYPGLTLSVLTAVILAKFTSAIEWAQQPYVYFSACIFLFLLWSYIGIEILRTKKQTQTVRIAHDYAYSLVMDGGLQVILAKFPKNHAIHPDANAVGISFNIRNVGQGPLRLKVEDIRLVLNGKTSDSLETPLTMTFARLGAKGIRIASIKQDAREKSLSGHLTFKFLYGSPDGDFLRAFSYKSKIDISVQKQAQTDVFIAAIQDEIIEEKDEPHYRIN